MVIFATVKWLESDTKVDDKKSSTSSTAEAIKNDGPKDKTVEEVKLEDKSKEKDPDKDAKVQQSKDVTTEENKANENSSIKTNEEVPKKNKKDEPVSTNDVSNYLTKILDQLKKIINNK